MFTKLAADITFSDVEDFCREFGEGVRVEYKREIQHIPKIVSSFANTLGGIFIAGVETDQNNTVKLPIQGIPNKSGIEEQIQQSTLTGIYPAVMSEVIIREVPDTDNVVVVVRTDESPQAPHAIQNSTRVYIRTGSITQPYELAEIDQIEYMLKRREDSQTNIRQIRNRTEGRIASLFYLNEPNITVGAHPVFPYRPIISTGDLYDFIKMSNSVPFNEWAEDFGTRRVAGGVCFIGNASDISYLELNEYGIVYNRKKLYKETPKHSNEQDGYLHYRQFVRPINDLIQYARSFYGKCEYLGNIEITVQLQQVYMETLGFHRSDEDFFDFKFEPRKRQHCLDSEVSASTQCLAQNLMEREEFIEVVDRLLEQLFWAFNVDDATLRRELVERIL